MTAAVLLSPDGTVREYTDLRQAKTEFAENYEVVSLHHPMFASTLHVGMVGAYSALDGSELNRKAWALYGGSPIYGPMLMFPDDGTSIAAEVATALLGNEWLTPDIEASMDAWLRTHPS